MTQKGFTFQWINVGSSQCWVAFTKVMCEISPSLAKGQSAQYYVLTIEDYNKILFHAQ